MLRLIADHIISDHRWCESLKRSEIIQMVCHANQWSSPVDDDGFAANAKCQRLADGVELSGRAPKIYRPPLMGSRCFCM